MHNINWHSLPRTVPLNIVSLDSNYPKSAPIAECTTRIKPTPLLCPPAPNDVFSPSPGDRTVLCVVEVNVRAAVVATPEKAAFATSPRDCGVCLPPLVFKGPLPA